MVFALSHPEKLEKWFSILLKLLGQLPGIFRGAHKQYVKHDLQGRVNSFVRGLAKQAPYLEARRLSLEWVEGEITKRSFLQDDKVVIRLKRDDPHDLIRPWRIRVRFDEPRRPGKAVHLDVAAGRR